MWVCVAGMLLVQLISPREEREERAVEIFWIGFAFLVAATILIFALTLLERWLRRRRSCAVCRV